MQVELKGKVALVTGSARRVGKVIALELAKQGVNILVHYYRAEPGEVRDALQEIKSLGVDAYGVEADISRAEGVDTLFVGAARTLRTPGHCSQQRFGLPAGRPA